jgi:hypothetical protein
MVYGSMGITPPTSYTLVAVEFNWKLSHLTMKIGFSSFKIGFDMKVSFKGQIEYLFSLSSNHIGPLDCVEP